MLCFESYVFNSNNTIESTICKNIADIKIYCNDDIYSFELPEYIKKVQTHDIRNIISTSNDNILIDKVGEFKIYVKHNILDIKGNLPPQISAYFLNIICKKYPYIFVYDQTHPDIQYWVLTQIKQNNYVFLPRLGYYLFINDRFKLNKKIISDFVKDHQYTLSNNLESLYGYMF